MSDDHVRDKQRAGKPKSPEHKSLCCNYEQGLASEEFGVNKALLSVRRSLLFCVPDLSQQLNAKEAEHLNHYRRDGKPAHHNGQAIGQDVEDGAIGVLSHQPFVID